jgi:small conductance mechanosensitive channel
MDPMPFVESAIPFVTLFVLKVIGALVIWVIGRKLIHFTARLVVRSFRYPFDQTVAAYIGTAVTVLLTIGLILALLGFFGIETTSFAALLAGVGLAIGAAWSGLLANLAAGIFILILRPFKVGDFISGGSVLGTVNDVGLFVTSLTTLDNVKTFVGNNKLLGDTIQNFSANPYRRVDLVAQLDHRVDPAQAIRLLKQRLAAIPNVMTDPPADVEILTVRPYCNNAHYWQVYFDTNRVIRETFGEAGFPAPEQHFAVRSGA